MKFKNIISKFLIFGLILNISIVSCANVLSEDDRYETFKGDYLVIPDVLEQGKVDVEVEGNTLVNLLGEQGQELVLQSNRTDDKYRSRLFTDLNLKPNTTYTFITDISNLSSSDTSSLKLLYYYTDQNGNASEIYPNGHYSKEDIAEGKVLIVFTTSEIKPDSKLNLYVDRVGSSTGSSTEFTFETSNCILLEGDWSNKEIPRYFDGMKSVGEQEDDNHSIEIKSQNQSLFNAGNFYTGKSGFIKEYSINLKLKEPLRSLPNGTKDRIIKKDDKWVVERNCAEVILTEESIKRVGYNYNEINVDRIELNIDFFKNIKISDWVHTMTPEAVFEAIPWSTHSDSKNTVWTWFHSNQKTFHILCPKGTTLEEAKSRLLNTKVVYQLKSPVYETLEVSPNIKLFEGITYISNDSTIPVNMKVLVDRVANKAKEFTERARLNPTVENIALARMWINLMDESALKDSFQDTINNVGNIGNMTMEKKSTTANLDLYIKSENMLSLSLDTNSVTFSDFNGTEDMVKENAIGITINSSLPYTLNAYLSNEIQNSDKSKTMNKNIFNIKESSEVDYQTFNNTIDAIVIKDNNLSGNNINHSIDLMLKGGIAHEKDVYKTTIKFEAIQK